MNKLNLFKEGQENSDTRRSFVKKSIAAIFGAAAFVNTSDLLAMKSKTGLVYMKKNGEIINNYKPMGGLVPMIGQISCIAFTFTPPNWLPCDGQIVSINEYTSLFSLIGTIYGGNGTTSFALPDLRGRVPIHYGQGPGLTARLQGDSGGEENHTLVTGEIPDHTHDLNASSAIGTSNTPSGNFLAQNAEGINGYSAVTNSTMHATAIGSTGGGTAHNNMQPYLALGWIIATEGVFPTHD